MVSFCGVQKGNNHTDTGSSYDLPDRVSRTEPGDGDDDSGRLGIVGKAGLTAVLIGFSVWLGWFGYHYFRAEQHMAVVKTVIKADPIKALFANTRAYQEFPWPVELRRQYGGAFLAAMMSSRAIVEPEAAALMWEISKSVSPWDASGLVSRAAYLLNHRREDIGIVADMLARVAPWSPETWVIGAYREIFRGDKTKAQASLDRARETLRLDPNILVSLQGAIGAMK
jgi:hypothetical protein